MSLPSEIIQIFGTSSVPAIVAGTVLGVFELGERFASQRAKDALSKWLVSFDIQKANALPDGTQELFERIFGERHFSWKCFVRSAAFSLGAIAFITIVSSLINPNPSEVFYHGEGSFNWSFLMLWVVWSIAIDYVSLLKTRVVLGLLLGLRRRTTIVAIAILAADYIAYKVIYVFGVVSVGSFGLFLREQRMPSTEPREFLEDYFSSHAQGRSLVQPGWVGLAWVLFWAGFAPSLWMWLYVLALFVTRGLLRSEKLVSWLRWALDVEKTPFRSIGAVAATLAFIASVVIILVSVEVSRISAA